MRILTVRLGFYSGMAFLLLPGVRDVLLFGDIELKQAAHRRRLVEHVTFESNFLHMFLLREHLVNHREMRKSSLSQNLGVEARW
jgi:hypothetical protein